MFPCVWKAPPMTATRRTRLGRAGSRSSAVAKFVSGPMAMMVMRPGCSLLSFTIAWAALHTSGWTGGVDGACRTTFPRPFAPWTNAAPPCAGRTTGLHAPRYTGTSGVLALWARARSTMLRAFPPSFAMSTRLPWTIVRARTRSFGDARARRIAKASSQPGSQSMMTSSAADEAMLGHNSSGPSEPLDFDLGLAWIESRFVGCCSMGEKKRRPQGLLSF